MSETEKKENNRKMKNAKKKLYLAIWIRWSLDMIRDRENLPCTFFFSNVLVYQNMNFEYEKSIVLIQQIIHGGVEQITHYACFTSM